MFTDNENNAPSFDKADRLRKALRVSDVSVQDMADFLCVNRNTAGRFLNGTRDPKPPVVLLWSIRTGVSYEWLLHGGADVSDDDGEALATA